MYSNKFYQGKSKNNYFEGWYYKLVTADECFIFAIIPGISLHKNKEHCFIQLTGNFFESSHYISYPLSLFSTSEDSRQVNIGNSNFQFNGINIDIDYKELNIKGKIQFKNLVTPKRNTITPSAMGFFAYMPIMKCYHDVFSMQHDLCGTLTINNKKICFTGGRGYIEKDWGTSFPQKYIWLQSNHFSSQNISIMCTVAHVPFMASTFQGFICILCIDDSEYRFATYNGSSIKQIIVTENTIDLQLKSRNYTLKISAQANDAIDLIAPISGNMNRRIRESFNGKIQIRLFDKENNIVLNSQGTIAGVEIIGY